MHDLIDEFRMWICPVVLGAGKRFFGDGTIPAGLKLVDELRLVVAPAVVGGGRRVFDGDDGFQTLELLDVQRSPKGTLFLAYLTQGPGR
jgi:dihydrofolate reductase